jgi:predicted Zn-dependent peptidase
VLNLYSKHIHKSGLRIITSNMPSTRSVCIAVFIGIGSRYESDEEAGTCHFIEHMCFKGTKRRPSPMEIAETIEGVGGMMNGGTGKESTTFWCKVAKPHFPLALDFLTDILRNPKFDVADLERERGVIQEELKESVDSPQDRVCLVLNELMWPGQPLGRDIIGTRESINSLNRDSVLQYMRECYGPGNSVVAIAGDLNHDDIISMVEKSFKGWPKVKARAYVPANDVQRKPRIKMEKRDTEQVHLCLGIKGLSIVDPDRYKLDLLNVVLGGGMSSRLNQELREKRGLVYDVDSYVDYYLDSGALTVYAGVDSRNAEDAVSAIMEELTRLKDSVKAPELTKVKELVKGRLMLGMEDTRSVASWAGRQEISTGRVLTVDDVVSIVDKIQAEDIIEVAERLFVTENLSLAMVGPVSSEERLKDLLHF